MTANMTTMTYRVTSRKGRGGAVRQQLWLASVALSALFCGCAHNVNDALAEIQYGDPVSVREAIQEVGELLVRKERTGYALEEADREALALLEDLAAASPDSVIRATAISTLARLETPDSTEVFLKALQDNSAAWIVRHEAAKALTARPDPRAAGPLTRQLAEERNSDVQLAIVPALAAVGGEEALRAVLELFLDPSTRARKLKGVAYEAVLRLSGEQFSFRDLPSWEAYAEQRFPEDESR
jgi:hypothetical protein